MSPKNIDNLYQDKFRFVLKKIPTAVFLGSEANIPGISIQTQQVANPVNYINVAGYKVYYEDFQFTFRVNENLENYRELYNWIHGIGAPQTPLQFAQLNSESKLVKSTGYNIKSDATLISLTTEGNLKLKINFADMFPYSLSSINFNHATNTTVTATAAFKYLNYTFEEA